MSLKKSSQTAKKSEFGSYILIFYYCYYRSFRRLHSLCKDASQNEQVIEISSDEDDL